MSRMIKVNGVWTEPKGYARLWLWFGLSRASWLTMPRLLMHEMPDDWQMRMAELCEEWDTHWPNQPNITIIVSAKQGGKFAKMPIELKNYRHPDEAYVNSFKAK